MLLTRLLRAQGRLAFPEESPRRCHSCLASAKQAMITKPPPCLQELRKSRRCEPRVVQTPSINGTYDTPETGRGVYEFR